MWFSHHLEFDIENNQVQYRTAPVLIDIEALSGG